MNPSDPKLPAIPTDLDNSFYEEFLNVVGYELAFPAVDAAWRALCRAGYTVVPVRTLARTRGDG